MNEKNDFIQWLEEKDCFLKKVIERKQILFKWFSYLREEEYENVCNKLYDVLNRCDEIEYNDSEVAAYVLTHFLDRYYRSLLIFKKLYEMGYLPERKEMKIMDIGTGPGMTLYAYSDFMNLLTEYKREKGLLDKIEISLDYVEYSDAFCRFLHQFTEMGYFDFWNNPEKVVLPFQGTYRDVREFDLSGRLKYDNGCKCRFVPRSYNMVAYSNFLTNENMVSLCYKQIKEIMFWMRNKGILLIIGGDPQSKKYVPVYKKIDQAISEQNYKTKRFYGDCVKVTGVAGLKMSYQRSGQINQEIADFHRTILNKLTNGNLTKIDKRYMKILKTELEGEGEEIWWISVYMKRSRYRKNKINDN